MKKINIIGKNLLTIILKYAKIITVKEIEGNRKAAPQATNLQATFLPKHLKVIVSIILTFQYSLFKCFHTKIPELFSSA